jgi:preprotein translocase subunit SecE
MKEKIIAFFQGVIKEMKKVTWPTKENLKESTIVVLIVCLAIAVFVYAIDQSLSFLLKTILS